MPTNFDSVREAKRFEQDLAEALLGRRVFMSGAGMVKADVRRPVQHELVDKVVRRSDTLAFRVEAKTTQTDGYTFQANDWIDLVRVADASGELPIFAVRFLRKGDDLVVVRRGLAQELGLMPADDTLLLIKRSLRLRPGAHNVLRVMFSRHPDAPPRPDILVVAPYDRFVDEVQVHAHFNPRRT